MTSLSQAVQEAIKNDLPGLAANELSQFIKQAETTASALKNAESRITAMEIVESQLRAELSKHNSLDARERNLTEITTQQQAKELELLKREAFMEAKIAQAELGGVKYSMESFLRNVTVRSTVISDVAKPVDGIHGGNGYSGSPGYLARDPRPDTHTTTETPE